jgi:hypothetical protein
MHFRIIFAILHPCALDQTINTFIGCLIWSLIIDEDDTEDDDDEEIGFGKIVVGISGTFIIFVGDEIVVENDVVKYIKTVYYNHYDYYFVLTMMMLNYLLLINSYLNRNY